MQKQGLERVIIQMPGVTNDEMDKVRTIIEKVAKLEFRLVHPSSDSVLARVEGGGPVEPGWVEAPHRDEEKPDLMVKNRVGLEGKHVTKAFAYLDPQKGWTISLDFDRQGGKRFGELTRVAAEDRSRLAAIIDGEVISAPGVLSLIHI